MRCRFFYKCLAFILFPMAMYGKADFSVFNLTCEQAENPLGIETQQPRFSWQIRSSERNFVQSSYEVLVADSPEMLEGFARINSDTFFGDNLESRNNVLLESTYLGSGGKCIGLESGK